MVNVVNVTLPPEDINPLHQDKTSFHGTNLVGDRVTRYEV